jgi:PRTRC genetic system protein B
MSLILEAKSAIIAYDDSYAEWHAIKNGKLGIGRPLTKEMLGDLKALIDEENTIQSISGVVPKGLYYFNSSSFDFKLIWHSPQQERKLHFKNFSGYATIPAMVWSIKGNTLSVFFVNSIKENSYLYQAPFPNLSTDGDVCFGNVDWKPKSSSDIQGIIKLTERLFFNSIFTDEVRVSFKEKFNLVAEWKKLVSDKSDRKRACTIPKKMLIKKSLKIEDLWEEYI